MIAQLKKLIAPLHKRVMISIARGILKSVNDATGVQRGQVAVLDGEVRENVERFQEYGFTSVPFADSEALVVRVGGNSDHGIIVAVEDRRYRLKGLAEGEVAIYTDEGDYVKFGRNSQVTVHSESKITVQSDSVEIQDTAGGNTSTVTLKGDLIATGDIYDKSGSGGRSMRDMRDFFNLHTHAETGSTTDVPGSLM